MRRQMTRRTVEPRPASTRSVACGVLMLALLATPFGCRKGQSERPTAAREPVPVEVVSPTRMELPRSIRATGTLYGDDETTIAAEVAGRIIEVARDLGDVVEPGEVLVRIDPTPFSLQRDERASALLEALAQLGLQELPTERFDVDAVPSVEAGRVQAENARARFERGRQLAERSPPLISEQDFADLRTSAEVAESGLRTARLAAEARLAEARTLAAQLRIAERRLADATVRAPAPMEGSASIARTYAVAERRVSVGDFVSVGQALVRLVDADPIKLRVRVVERRLGQVAVGQAVEVRLEAFSEPFVGEVARVSPVVEQTTRSFPVEILIANPQRTLKPGSFAAASIRIGSESAIVVPASVLATFAGIHKVLAIKDGAIDEVRVEIGERFESGGEELIEIRSPIPDDLRVVRKPSGSLVHGTPVRIAEREPAR